jgi:hypothetical protein
LDNTMVGRGVGPMVGEAVRVGVEVGTGVKVGDGVSVWLGVAVSVAVRVGVGVMVWVGVGWAVSVAAFSVSTCGTRVCKKCVGSRPVGGGSGVEASDTHAESQRLARAALRPRISALSPGASRLPGMRFKLNPSNHGVGGVIGRSGGGSTTKVTQVRLPEVTLMTCW